MLSTPNINVYELDRLAALPTSLAMAEAGPLLEALVHESGLLGMWVAPLLAQVAPADEPYIAHTILSPGGGCSLQVFVWAPGSRTPIHDHTSWGAYYCVAGTLREDRYARLDDGTQLNQAHLRASWRRTWSRADGVSTVAPYAGGIHRIANPTRRPAISLHLYGPRVGSLDGRDYDPARDYVCDRYEAAPDTGLYVPGQPHGQRPALAPEARALV